MMMEEYYSHGLRITDKDGVLVAEWERGDDIDKTTQLTKG